MSSHVLTPFKALFRLVRQAGKILWRTPLFPGPAAIPSRVFRSEFRNESCAARYCRCGIPVPDRSWRCSEGCYNGRD